jgi:hypothetical protein
VALDNQQLCIASAERFSCLVFQLTLEKRFPMVQLTGPLRELLLELVLSLFQLLDLLALLLPKLLLLLGKLLTELLLLLSELPVSGRDYPIRTTRQDPECALTAPDRVGVYAPDQRKRVPHTLPGAYRDRLLDRRARPRRPRMLFRE